MKSYKLTKTKSSKKRLTFSNKFFEKILTYDSFVYNLAISKLVKDFKNLNVDIFLEPEQEKILYNRLNEDSEFINSMCVDDYKVMMFFEHGFLNSKICDIEDSLKIVNNFYTMLKRAM